MTLNVPVATAGNSDAFREVAGMVTLTPAAGSNNGVTLRVPYYLVPRAQANVRTTVAKLQGNSTSTTATITNKGGAIPATYDFYAWGLEDGKEPGSKASNDIRAVGVQSFPISASQAADRLRGQRPQPLVERSHERVRHPARRQR